MPPSPGSTAPPGRAWSATVLVGALAGVAAGLAVLAAVLPLNTRLIDLRDAHGFEEVQEAAAVAVALSARGLPVEQRVIDALSVDYLLLSEEGGLETVWGGPSLPAAADTRCNRPPEAQSWNNSAGERFVSSCARYKTHRSIAVLKVPRRELERTLWWGALVLSLLAGAMVGLAVHRTLLPLKLLSTLLERVRLGERSVQAQTTGLEEIDRVVEQFNLASEQVAAREDEIVDRVHVARELSRMVAHEVRNPLQSLGLLTTLLSREADATERQVLAEQVHDEIRSLDDVVRRLLNDQRGGLRIRTEPRALGPLLDRVVGFRQQQAAAKGARLVLHPAASTPVPVDAALFRRSVSNLVDNALRAVPRGRGVVEVSVAWQGEHAELRVDDNGPGIDPGLAERIFDADVSQREDGTGLGLALVRGVFTAHGGSVAHSTSPLGGARFVGRLPLGTPEETSGAGPR